MDIDLKNPWLIAVWPGMGGIAQIAGSYLVHALGAQWIGEIPAEPWFDVRSIRVREGLIQPRRLPRNLFYGWKNPGRGRDLVIFVGDEQVATRGYPFCEAVLQTAAEMGVSRICTFAAMGTPIRPEAEPRVFAAASDAKLLTELKSDATEVLGEAEISGLNGLLLAAAVQHGHEGLCLLGEFPFFASAVANPKASVAILRVFGELAGVHIDLTELDERGKQMERLLAANLEQLEELAREQSQAAAGETGAIAASGGAELDLDVEARIEALFAEAAGNRAKALELKAELDRHGVFERYEDRFLDLFKQAE